MRKLSIFTILFCVLSCGFSYSQDITFRAEAPNQVTVGQPFNIVFALSSTNGSRLNATEFRAPTFRNLEIQSGPSQSTYNSTQFINGVRTQTVSLQLTYRVIPRQKGIINIGQASIVVDGTTYTSQGISIQANPDASSQAQQPQNQRQSAESTQRSDNRTNINNEDLFILANVSKSAPYEGEEVIVSYNIYTAVSVSSYSIYKIPSSADFWVEELPALSQQAHATSLNGRRYQTAEIRRIAAYPQRNGKLSIAPLEIEAVAQMRIQDRHQPSDPFGLFDDFFSTFGSVQNIKKELKSNVTTFNVKPLPEYGKPASFRGNVGRFQFTSKTDKTTLKTNEAITISVTISGKGNLRHIEPPEIVFPGDFEVYDPRTIENITVGNQGITGSITFEYLAIPRTQGIYTIPEIKFSYFDPSQERYIEHKSPKQQITVNKGEAIYSTTGIKGDDYQNRDIEFIKTKSHTMHPKHSMSFLFSTWFWILTGIIPALFVIFCFINRRLKLINNDVVGLRRRQALSIAKRCLRKAAIFMNDNEKADFYIEISQALWGFLSRKYNIPVAELSIETVHRTLNGKDISNEHIVEFLKALEDCEFARFAPGGQALQSMRAIYDKALEVITNISAYQHE